MVMRWKKHPYETGLLAVGAGPRGSTLHDGDNELATVYAARKRLEVIGWYWVSRCGGKLVNTCNSLVADEVTAKADAMKHVKENIAKEQPA